MRVGLSMILPGTPFCGGRGGAAAGGTGGHMHARRRRRRRFRTRLRGHRLLPGRLGNRNSCRGNANHSGVASRIVSDEEKIRSPVGSNAGHLQLLATGRATEPGTASIPTPIRVVLLNSHMVDRNLHPSVVNPEFPPQT